MAYVTLKQQLVFKALLADIRNKTIRPLGVVLLEAGYSKNVSKQPTLVTKSKGFQELMDDILDDDSLINVHKTLLKSQRIDHMVFPLGPKEEDEEDSTEEHTALTDDEITAMLQEVGGTVRRIVHGRTARHVYFWVSNDKARQDALKLAYDIKGKLGKRADDPGAGNTYNTFIQNNTMNPNTPSSKQLVDATLDVLMQQTKRKAVPNEQVRPQEN